LISTFILSGVFAMKKQFYASVAFAALAMPGAAFAQSTGSLELDDEIIVTASTEEQGIEGLQIPDGQKPRAVLTQELIAKQGAGQSILNTINQVPGVNFTNSDAYGSSGGNLRIRGFDGNRISLTFDGFPLNDTGNYAIFSNQQLDPELISSVNVNLGTTDVDSPTASAAGGTVNYLTRKPSDDLGGLAVLSAGEDDFYRGFLMIDTGEFTSFGTKAFVSASRTVNDKFKGPGKISKKQVNAGIYQPLGDGGDFIYLKAHYNENRNNFYRNIALNELRSLTVRPGITEIGGFNKLQEDALFGFDNLATCNRTLVGGVGIQNDNGGTGPAGIGPNAPNIAGNAANNVLNTSSCSNFYGIRINPSNTGNVRLNSRYSLTDNLTLTVDGGYQYVLANGGGSSTIAENDPRLRGASLALGKDLNGDGDFVDTIRFYTPNTTNTNRFTLLSSLIWDVNDDHRVRVAYTFDRGRHRQTGQWGYLNGQGFAENVFGGLNGRPLQSVDGVDIRQRDRLSIALLNQLSGEYRGQFFDDALTVSAGLRMPFFKRDLENFCYTQALGSGFATCTSQVLGTVAAAGTTYLVPDNYVPPLVVVGTPVFRPFTATYKFSPVLPSAGLTYKITDDLALFGSYAKGFSAPRTDNLYRSILVTVAPETTNTFDLGVRYTTSRFQAQATAWSTSYKNRIVTSFDQALGISVDRNVGSVKAKGVDFGMAVRPYDWFTFQGNVSYNDSKLQDDIQTSTTVFIPTSGKRVTETPVWQAGYRAQVEFGPVQVGLQVKYVADRFATDLNDIKSASYTLADLDARVNLDTLGMKNSSIQFNVSNLFDRFYVGNLGTQIAGPNNNGLVLVPGLLPNAAIPGGANPNFAIGSPRTISASLKIGF
jgi:iron complex outermembrane recepter protein